MNEKSSVNDLQSENGEKTCRVCALPGRVLRKLERERFIEGRGWGYIVKAILPPLLPPGYPSISRELLANHLSKHVPESVVLAYQGERGRRDPLPEERDDLVSDVLRDHIEHYAALQDNFLVFEGVIGALKFVLRDSDETLISPLVLSSLIEELEKEGQKGKDELVLMLMKVVDSQKSIIEQCRKLTPVKEMLTSLLIRTVNQIGEKWRDSLSGALNALERDLRGLVPNHDVESLREKMAEAVKGTEVTILSQSIEDKDAVLMGLDAMMKTRFDTYVSE